MPVGRPEGAVRGRGLGSNAPERGCRPLLGVGASRLALSQKAHRRSAEGTGPCTFGGAEARLCGLGDWAGKMPSGPPTLLFSYGSIYLSHKRTYPTGPERKPRKNVL